MAGIKIIDLPPNALPLVGDELMELENADGNSTRTTVADIASSASGLDASFITVDPNAALPNERVLTEGTNITLVDTGPNGTLTINAAGLSFPLLAPDGSVGAPSYSFASDPDSGMYLNAVGELSFAADGVEIARAINGAQNQFAIAQSGQSSVPDLTSLGDLDTGFRWTGSNQVVWIGGGSRAWNFSTARFFSQFSNGPSLENIISQGDVPTVLPDQGDSNTGLGRDGSDELSLVAGGVQIAQAKESVGANQFIIAPGVTQNAAATPSLAFGDGDTGFSEPLDDNFKVSVAGVFRFFWELDSFNAETGTGPAMVNEVPSATNPVFVPRRSDSDTGLGSNALNEPSLIGGGIELARGVAPASGGLLANNTLTGAGLERVLTASDLVTLPDPLLLSDGSAPAPSYSFASDTDIGMFRVGADILGLSAGAVTIAQAVGDPGANQFVVAPGAVQNNVVAPDLGFGDGDTGVMQTVDDTIALVAGTILAVRYAESGFGITQINASGTGLVASVTQTQAGGLALLSSYNEIATVANSGDALTAFPVLEGSRLTIVNNGANDLQLFPAVGDDFGAGVDTAITIRAGEIGIFLGRDSTNWDTLFNNAASGISFPLLAPDGTAGAPSYSFSGETDLGMFRLAEDFLGFSVNGITRIVVDTSGITGFIGNSGKIVSVGATANFPSVLAANGDTNTGMGWGGIDIVTLAAGGIEGVRFAEDASHIIQRNENQVALVASVTQTQAGGLALLSSYNEITTVANVGDALTAFDVDAGERLVVINNGVNDLQLFPASGDDFGAGVDTAITIAAGEIGIFLGRDSTDWDTLYNDGPSPGISGTVTNSMLRFDGASFIEETQIQVTAAGVLSIRDASLADSVSISHNGAAGTIASVGSTALNFTGVATQYSFDNNVVVAGDITVAGGNRLIVLDAVATDSVVIDHDGTDGNIVSTLTADLNFTGVSVGYKFDESIYITEKTAANADFAGLGQFWVRDDVPNIPMFTDDTGIDFKLGVANDAVQARRTTSYVLTTAFADVTLDTTDIETDGAILEHSGTTDQIEATVAGTYEFTYGADIDPSAAGNDNIQAFGRMRLNDAGVDLPGSLASQTAYEDASTIGNEVFGRLQCSFIVVLAAGDFLTLQLMKIETGGTGIFTAEEVTVTAKRLL